MVPCFGIELFLGQLPCFATFELDFFFNTQRQVFVKNAEERKPELINAAIIPTLDQQFKGKHSSLF